MHRWYSATVATMALTFQILVLEPWHKRISDEIRDLKSQVASLRDQ
jgi:hypothetical protein